MSYTEILNFEYFATSLSSRVSRNEGTWQPKCCSDIHILHELKIICFSTWPKKKFLNERPNGGNQGPEPRDQNEPLDGGLLRPFRKPHRNGRFSNP